MKQFLFNLCAMFLLCAAFPSNTFAQEQFWEPTTGPLGGYVTAITADKNHVFASVGGTLYHSSDYGISWEENEILAGHGILEIAIYGKEILLHTGDPGCWCFGPNFRSTDLGKTWTELHWPSSGIGGIAVNQDGVIMAIGSWVIFRSIDQGYSWTPLADRYQFPVGALLSSVAFDRNGMLFLGTSDSGLFRSTDNGDSWMKAGLSHIAISSIATTPNGKIIVASPDSGIYQSTDSGESWRSLGLKNLLASSVVVSREGDIFVSTDRQGIYRSDNNGETWSIINSDLSLYNPSLAIDGHDNVYASTTGGGIFRLSGNNSTWTQIGLTHVEALSLVANNSGDVFVGTNGGGIFSSTDNGDTWKHLINGLTTEYINALAIDNNGFVFAGAVNNNEGIYRSTNNGVSWNELHDGLNITSPYNDRPSVLSFAVNASNHIFAATYDGLFSTTDGGDHWKQLSDSSGRNVFRSVAIHPGGDVYVIHTTVRDSVRRSSDNGRTWETMSFPLNMGMVHLAINAEGIIFVGTEGNGIYRSSDNGLTWTPVNKGLMNMYVRTMFIHQSGTIYVGTRGHVHISDNNGDSWSELGTRQPPYDVKALAINRQGYLFAGTRGPVYRSNSPITSADPTITLLPISYSLSQNYPNPFNPTTTIRFTLPSAQFVNLSVYNVLGMMTETLFSGRKEAGSHEVIFDSSRYSSGVYWYRIQAGSFSDIKKLILLR